eukprot:1156858-Pelagomonas_calceolata.AAC.8
MSQLSGCEHVNESALYFSGCACLNQDLSSMLTNLPAQDKLSRRLLSALIIMIRHGLLLVTLVIH